MRPIELSRDDAELLDDLLKDHYEKTGSGRAHELGDQLCKIWGMTVWERRFDFDSVIVENPSIPYGEAHLMVGGKTVGKITELVP